MGFSKSPVKYSISVLQRRVERCLVSDDEKLSIGNSKPLPITASHLKLSFSTLTRSNLYYQGVSINETTFTISQLLVRIARKGRDNICNLYV